MLLAKKISNDIARHIAEIMPPGQYIIGDPCQFIDEARWDTFIVAMESNANATGSFLFDGHKVFAAETSIGDGMFVDGNGFEYPVDSGVIGVLPKAICKLGAPTGVNHDERQSRVFSGRELHSKQQFEVARYDDGRIIVGDIVIAEETEE